MNNQHEIIEKVGGLNKVKDLFQKLALDDVYCEETGKWYSGRYWQENMKEKKGILFDRVVSAFMLFRYYYSYWRNIKWGISLFY